MKCSSHCSQMGVPIAMSASVSQSRRDISLAEDVTKPLEREGR